MIDKRGGSLEFDVDKHEFNKEKYSKDDFDIVLSFAKELSSEIKELLRAVVIFGSAARHEKKANDIDVLVVLDDASVEITSELSQAYSSITSKIVNKVSRKLHITTLKYTTFWEYVRSGDPVGVNILRDGVAILDKGVFGVMQTLLFKGKIRPSSEAVWNYFDRAPRTLANAKWHVEQGVIDLYWACIDSAHAALMHKGQVPPSPSHVALMIEKVLVKKKLVPKTAPNTMRKFYNLSKSIARREIKNISGSEFDKLYAQAHSFVASMQRVVSQSA
ncbi:nucleotidyltransferase domain-containing protein [Candidatus Woesearchaeota archaeon]|nr:nucleotidyltransferase domain-containing protein [Candidatus Woesearchaeota archaeon]